MKATGIHLAVVICLFSTGLNSGLANGSPAIDQLIREKSIKYGLDQDLVKALIHRESGGNIRARSPKDARGIMQVIPSTASRMGVNPAHLYIPERNIEAGTRYLAYLNKMFNNHLPYVLAAYNAGEGAVTKYDGIPPYRETRLYVPAVISKYKSIKSGRSYSGNTLQSFLYGGSNQTSPKSNPILIPITDSTESIQSIKTVAVTSSQTQKGAMSPHINNQQEAAINNPESVQVARNNSFVITLQNDGTYK